MHVPTNVNTRSEGIPNLTPYAHKAQHEVRLGTTSPRLANMRL